MNTAMVAVPHPVIKDTGGTPVIKDIESAIVNNHLSYKMDTSKIPVSELSVLSPELGEEIRNAQITYRKKGFAEININPDGVKVYATVQNHKQI